MGISDVVSCSVWEHVRPVYDNSKHVALPRLCRIHDFDVIVAVKIAIRDLPNDVKELGWNSAKPLLLCRSLKRHVSIAGLFSRIRLRL